MMLARRCLPFALAISLGLSLGCGSERLLEDGGMDVMLSDLDAGRRENDGAWPLREGGVVRDAAGPLDSGTPTDPFRDAPGRWPITGTADPGCVQDPFGHRLLGGVNDFHPGWDTCDDDPDDIDGTMTGNEVGLEVRAIAAGVVTRVRPWDPAWDADPGACPGFCRQGTFVQLLHPSLAPSFEGRTVQSVYMHLALGSVPMTLVEGAEVAAGEVLGRVGRTGRDIRTVHLHFGLLVGSPEGTIDVDNYVNPLRILPYARPSPPSLAAFREDSVAAFDPDECAAVDSGASLGSTLAVRITESSPAFDTIRLEVESESGERLGLLDIDERVGVGVDGGADDFSQGCVAVEVGEFAEGSVTRELTVRFGGLFDEHRWVRVIRTDARGLRSSQVLEAPNVPAGAD